MTKQANANSTYIARMKQARLLLEAIESGLELHEQDQARSPEAWGHAGDLARVNEGLVQLADFLGVEPLE